MVGQAGDRAGLSVDDLEPPQLHRRCTTGAEEPRVDELHRVQQLQMTHTQSG